MIEDRFALRKSLAIADQHCDVFLPRAVTHLTSLSRRLHGYRGLFFRQAVAHFTSLRRGLQATELARCHDVGGKTVLVPILVSQCTRLGPGRRAPERFDNDEKATAAPVQGNAILSPERLIVSPTRLVEERRDCDA